MLEIYVVIIKHMLVSCININTSCNAINTYSFFLYRYH